MAFRKLTCLIHDVHDVHTTTADDGRKQNSQTKSIEKVSLNMWPISLIGHLSKCSVAFAIYTNVQNNYMAITFVAKKKNPFK